MMAHVNSHLCRFVFIFLVLFANSARANMASPLLSGDPVGNIIRSTESEIIREEIFLNISNDLKETTYEVRYYIKSQTGKTIPLLFHAHNYLRNFEVEYNKKKILLQPLDSVWKNESIQNKLNQAFPQQLSDVQWFAYSFDSTSEDKIPFYDLKYFEIPLTDSVQVITVRYTASNAVDRSDWVRTAIIRYALEPAKYWKSFGSLYIKATIPYEAAEIIAVPENFKRVNATTLEWNSNSISVPYFEFRYRPMMPATAVFVEEWYYGFLSILVIIALIIHFNTTKSFYVKNPNKVNLPYWTGAIVLPFLVLYGMYVRNSIIDGIIGEAASEFHGYGILILFLYPIVMPAYVLVSGAIYKFILRKK